jgi:hypothetical protein
MSRYGTPYRDCVRLQKSLELKANDRKTEARDVVSCVKSWIELEHLKREMRGIPRLASASLKEIAAAKRELMQQHPSYYSRGFAEPEPIEAAPESEPGEN